MSKYQITNKNNFGVIENVESLEQKQYEVIAETYLINQIEKYRPDLITYNSNTNIAITNKAEKLQEYVNNFDSHKNFKFVFVY